MPGCREVVIHEKNVFLCQVKNPESLGNEIKRFIELDYQSKLEMGLKSRELAELKFDINNVNNYYIQSLKNIKNARQ